MSEEKDSALNKLVWAPRLEQAIDDWTFRRDKAKQELEQYNNSIKKTKIYLKEIKDNRIEIFAEFLADEDQVIQAYTNERAYFSRAEKKLIYEKYNSMLIRTLAKGDVHRFKSYLWDYESFQKAADWKNVAKQLIKRNDIDIVTRFLEFKFEKMTEVSRELLVEYIDSRKLVGVMANTTEYTPRKKPCKK